MTLRLRIWAWALIVGLILYPASIYWSTRLSPLVGDIDEIAASMIFFFAPFPLFGASAMVAFACRNAMREHRFTPGEKSLFITAALLGSLPLFLVLALGTAIFMGYG